MERRKCRRCGHPMTRMLTNDAGRWSACYTCLNCGYETATVIAKSETAAEDGLERFMDRVDRAYETSAGRSAAPRKPQTAEADRALAAYGLYCQLCEALTGKPIAKMDELLTAAQKAKRELEAVDVAPVVHGRWQSNGIHGSVLCRCSECHYDAAAYSFRYCPMCGAKMDGEENAE